MNRMIRGFCPAALVLCCAPFLSAQQPAQMDMTKPPKVLLIEREWEKPGRSAAHQKIEAQFAGAFAAAKVPFRYLGMTAVTGGSEVWFISGYNSFADMEKAVEAVASAMSSPALQPLLNRLGPEDGDQITNSDRVVATYREDLSYNPDTPASIPHMHFLEADVVQLRPGYMTDYQESTRLFIEATKKADTGDHWEAYEIVTGAPVPEIIYFAARKSFGDYDAFEEMYGKKFDEALGENGHKKMDELEATSVQSEKDILFAFDPAISYPPDEWIKADPAFWAPKPAAKNAMRTAKKPAAPPSKQ